MLQSRPSPSRARVPRSFRSFLLLLLCASNLGIARAAGAAPDYKDLCPADAEGRRLCDVKVRTDANGVFEFDSEPVGGYGPADLQDAYGLSPTGGNGQIVALFAGNTDYTNAESDLGVYRHHYGLPPCTSDNGCFMKVDENGGTNYPPAGTNEGEQALDIEMASAACPGCRIMLIEGPDMNVALGTVLAMGASAFSFSVLYGYGSAAPNVCESFGFDSASGLLVTAALGDSSYPAARDYVPETCEGTLAVGGTSLTRAANSRGWAETTWAGTGSGCSPYVAKPAWQTDTGCPMRMESDVSAVADPDTGVAFYFTQGGNGWGVVGGTSAASPLVSGALTALGIANGHFTPAWVWQNQNNFFDVTSGSNGSCDGSPSYFCNAGVGYDGPTGWGTPNGSLLATAIAPGMVSAGGPSCVTPQGSYAETCASCAAGLRTTGCVLTCEECARIDGTLNLGPSVGLPCSGEISNEDGNLSCNGVIETDGGGEYSIAESDAEAPAGRVSHADAGSAPRVDSGAAADGSVSSLFDGGEADPNGFVLAGNDDGAGGGGGCGCATARHRPAPTSIALGGVLGLMWSWRRRRGRRIAAPPCK